MGRSKGKMRKSRIQEGIEARARGGGISEGEKESNKVHQVPAKGGWLR